MKAVILFSGGLDSTVMLAKALRNGRECLALSFNYGQRHKVELKAAAAIAQFYQVPHRIIDIDSQAFAKSALVYDKDVPKNRTLEEIEKGGIPSTYVPARNTLFLAYAVGQAEILEAGEIHFGPNALDYHPYCDCRPEYIHAFQGVINLATKQAVDGHAPKLVTPLLHLTKPEIIKLGLSLKAPLQLTHSCYDPLPSGAPCSQCDACLLRREGFAANGWSL